MVPQKNLETLQKRKDRHTYDGKVSKYQQEGNKYNGKRYTVYEVDEFNSYQNFLYRRALSGLKAYSPEELKTMHKSKIGRAHV